jgi:F0F1-type ATP synthase assembly protein I
MSGNIDFKALWQQQEVIAKPDAKEVIKKAGQLRKKARNRLLRVNSILVLSIAYYVFLGFNGHNVAITTQIGVLLSVLAFVAYLVVSNGLMMSLFKSHPETDSFAYLTELLAIRKREEFIQTRVLKLYMVVLTLGIILCMIDPVRKIDVLWGSVAYICVFAWMAFIFFYLKPRKIKRQRAEWAAVIEKLQTINDQLTQIGHLE